MTFKHTTFSQSWIMVRTNIENRMNDILVMQIFLAFGYRDRKKLVRTAKKEYEGKKTL